jgi:PAS domain S-box-containing protein
VLLQQAGLRVSRREALGIITKSHFVIPGVTRYECQMCGECCRYARKVAMFTYEPCPYLMDDSKCQRHDHRYQVCKWFPFWLHRDPEHGPLLMIKPYCSGYGKGPVVNYDETVARLSDLSRSAAEEGDGAFVIHEVLYIPDLREWVFPSRANVDRLLAIASREAIETRASAGDGGLVERPSEFLHAHKYTSGLLGAIAEPQLTINEKGLVTDVNEAFCDLMRTPRRSIAGADVRRLFANPERAETDIVRCFAQGKLTATPRRLRHADGSTVGVLLNAVTYRDRTDGLIHGALICLHEISPTVYSDLSQSQDYARGLIEASLDPMVTLDRDGLITDVNEAAVTITGRSRDRLIGSRFMEYFDDPKRAVEGIELTFASAQVRNYELNLIDSRGDSIPVSFNATVYRDAEGIVSGVFAVARDVRDLKDMFRQIEDAQSYARGLIESGIDLMVTVNRFGIITDVNEAATQLTGYARDRLVGSRFEGYFSEPEAARSGVELTFERGQVRNYQINLLNNLGESVPVSFNATVYRDSRQVIQGVFGIARDMRR